MNNESVLELVFRTNELEVLQDKSNLENLAAYLNQLILADFEKLVSLLYRIDVSENKLKKMLAEHKDSDAGKIIAQLIIDRQIQKIQLKKQMSSEDDKSCEEERW